MKQEEVKFGINELSRSSTAVQINDGAKPGECVMYVTHKSYESSS